MNTSNYSNCKNSFFQKKGWLLAGLLLSATAFSCATSETARQEKAVLKAKMAQAVGDSITCGRFQVDVDRAFPQRGGRMVVLSSPYYVRVSGDTLLSRLPFFGRAYSIPYGGGSGLNFDGRIVSRSSVVSKKGEHIVKLGVTSAEDAYDYTISIFDNGSASVSVTPRQRSQMYFTGTLHTDW